MKQNIKFKENHNKKYKPKTPPPFGTVFGNYMFEMTYDKKNGWHNPEIKPYEGITLDPSTLCLHYGQTIFEGMKVIKVDDKRVLFRPKENFKRLNKSAKRMCMPEIDIDFALKALIELIKAENDEWFYNDNNSSVYIRPFMIATEAIIGAHISNEYKFYIILTPMSNYFSSKQVKLITETKYMRVAAKGTGEAKNGGNYGSSFYATKIANEKGYEQILWLDPLEQKYIEEAGMMNIFFV
ncbi:aminotransferase class IV, partial [Erysipelotrichaceae bacterium OttesenSCG-928-M19]|nr:aminotransferase class IV [Erysipelotrichaceae bacterium OttesenSCG-928-M19]